MRSTSDNDTLSEVIIQGSSSLKKIINSRRLITISYIILVYILEGTRSGNRYNGWRGIERIKTEV